MKLTWAKLLFTAWIFVFSISSAPSMIEGKIYPVVDDVHITRMLSDNEHTSLLSMTFEIKRHCTIKNIKIYYPAFGGLKQNYTLISLENNIPESFTYGTAIINLPKYLYFNMNSMYITSNCHSLWDTYTKIYG